MDITCAVCGRVVPIERSRLFWGKEGTFRTCMKGISEHKWNGKKYIKENSNAG